MHILNFDRLEEDFEANSYYVAAASYLQQLKALLLQESVEDDLEAVNDRALLRFCKAIKLAKVVDGKIQDNSGTLRKQITDIEEFLERAKRVFNLFAKIGEDGALFDKLQGLSAESHDTNIMQFLSRTKLSELGKVDAVSLISMERFGKELIGGGASAYFPELGDLIGKHLQHFPHEKVAEDAEYAVNSVLNGLGVTVGDLSELNRFVNGTDAKNRI